MLFMNSLIFQYTISFSLTFLILLEVYMFSIAVKLTVFEYTKYKDTIKWHL